MKTKMKTKAALLSLLVVLTGLNSALAQVGIGTTSPDASAALDVDVSSLTDKKGFLPPRMNTAERDAISSPAEGGDLIGTKNMMLNSKQIVSPKGKCL